jgi:GntR family transcriptional regulator, transcriptional repressor for pyruvate dehydrogenase complex
VTYPEPTEDVVGMPIQLQRQTLAEQVADNLVALIEDKGLPPGTLLPSALALGEEFGVSRPVVREALKSLEAKGVIEVTNGKGAVVKPVTSDPLQDFFQRALRIRHVTALELLEVRKGIEVQSAILAARRRTAGDVSAIAQELAALREHLRDPDAFIRIDATFHLLIAAASHNKLMHHLVESLREPLKESIRAVQRHRVTDQQHELAYTAHANIFGALERGEPAEAGSAMATHFNEAIRLITEDGHA